MKKSAKYDTSLFQVMLGIEGRSVKDVVFFQELDNRPTGHEDDTVREGDMKFREAQLLAVDILRVERKTSPGDYTFNPSFKVGETVALLQPNYQRFHRWYLNGSAPSS